jgi:hypothetical protein
MPARIHHLFLILFLLLFIWSCKKDKSDKTAPNIHVATPGQGTQYHMFDTVRFSAELHDETSLQRVEIGLYSQDGSPVQNSIAIDLSGTDYHLDDWMDLYEFRIPTGDYNLIFTLSDGSNTTTQTVSLHIIESPVVKKGYYFVSKTAANHTYIRTDAAYAQTAAINHSGTYEGSAITNYYQQLYAASGVNQDFRTYNMNNGLVKWTLNNAGTAANITCCTSDGKNVILGKNDGNVYKYNQDGALLRSYISNESNYYVKRVYTAGDYVIAQLYDFSNTDRKAVVFESATGNVRKVLLSTDVKAVMPKSSNELYIFSNSLFGHALLEVLTLPGGSSIQRFDFGAYQAYDGCLINSNTMLLSTSEGKIWYFENSSTNAFPVLNTVQAKQMKIDNRVDELYVASDKNFYLYYVSPFSLTPAGSTTRSDTIADFQVIFNK